MLKRFVPTFLIVTAAFVLGACDTKEVRACKKLAHNQIEEVCNATKQELKRIKENQELDDAYKSAAEEAIMAQYSVCFDDESMKQAIEKVDLACESDPSVMTRK